MLRVHAQVWATALDQDGAEPRERDIAFRRGVTLGRARNGVIPIRGDLLPDVAAQFQRIFDATYLHSSSVQFAGDGLVPDDAPDRRRRARMGGILDDRTGPQRDARRTRTGSRRRRTQWRTADDRRRGADADRRRPAPKTSPPTPGGRRSRAATNRSR